MRAGQSVAFLVSLVCFVSSPVAADEDGFISIFDGKTLEGWDGNPKFWRVEDEAVTGQTTAENPTKGNTFIVWREGEVDDFELKLKYRIVGGNSGIQYRSWEEPDNWGRWVIGGYQADFEAGDTWSGTLYGERYRGVLAARGQKTVVGADHKPKVVGSVGDSAKLQEHIKKEQWNDYHIIANGNHFIHKINGVVMAEATDDDQQMRRAKGLLALQLHAGPPMKVQFKDIRLKRTKLAGGRKKVVFVAGNPSHGWGSHEHNAGCLLLAKALNDNTSNVLATVYHNGWPSDPTAFDNADAVVFYCDGGGGHYINRRLESFDKLMKKGVGLACIHYAVEVPKGDPGNHFLDWIGGYFETYWSVNPHWDADFTALPNHPITRGVKPFKVNDEWYYHMRFRDESKGVTPILTATPPDSTRMRNYGKSHGGNPFVVKRRGKPEHVAWATERPDGGRGFGFTGGHFHRNWGHDDFRKLVLNAITWIAKAEVPENGVESPTPSQEQLEANQDYPKPDGNTRRQRNRKARKSKSPSASTPSKATFASKIVDRANPRVSVEAPIKDAKQLFLVVTDAGNGFSCDWADWAEPRLVGPAGETKLTDLKWKSATTDWGKVRVNKNAGGGPLKIAGEFIPYGIGTHANSTIVFDLPANHEYTHFKATAGLDNGGSDQGGPSSVTFAVYTETPPRKLAENELRDVDNAARNLDVADGLEATLFAGEPMLLSPSNIDVDHKGRVWVCEVVNYRGRNGERPEGDRILILEDTDQDGVADKRTVFYQGRDVDTALGICVLGDKVIVSVAPDVFIFTDEDGDGKADKKEQFFSKVGQPQHDHSTHAFLFGPDGKLYWNVGNTGKHVHDRYGNLIVDKFGNKVVDNGKPYFGGMPFRCNVDGTGFEVLGHNFRNNYEVTVDSFGTVWQSDNDDDGNRGVRINYVMEFGNYGYRDEMTGEGWRTPRTGMHPEIPKRHWHLNDPGVVPNLLQTGAGSPTGICVYEGRLLPEVFWDQVVHCDAGPNVVRAYPAEKDGAGYQAKIVKILSSDRDKWFRPSDVCVAPDGSLIVADWYDPGVGGHRMGDVDKGRIFRVAPPDAPYKIPQFDYSTIEGAAKALANPNLDVRYRAWTKLHESGASAEAVLLNMFESEENPRLRARALWLLAKIPGRGQHYVDRALADENENIRIVGLRVARQLELDLGSLLARLVKDPSPQVRRECAVAMHHWSDPKAPELWAQLAAQHDGKDRWYLEALGIAAAGKWDDCLNAYLDRVDGDLSSDPFRDIVWRSRAAVTPKLLAEIISRPDVSKQDATRYLRAFDFQTGADKEQVLTRLAFESGIEDEQKRTYVASETIGRLNGFDVNAHPERKQVLTSLLDEIEGTTQFVDLVRRFNVRDRVGDVLAIAQKHPQDELGVHAVRSVLSIDRQQVAQALKSTDEKLALATTQVLGTAADGRAMNLLMPIINDPDAPLEVRRQAVRSIGAIRNGALALLKMAQDKKIDEPLLFVAAAALNGARWRDVQTEAAKLFPVPPTKNNKPLPPITQLVDRRGNPGNGKRVFDTTGTCAKCHKVGGQGKDVGPDLSEIGSKLSKHAMFESILFPSAGISHNYEAYVIALEDGNVVSGLITSQTDDSISVKLEDGIIRKYSNDEVAALKKSKLSMMPADVQKNLTADELVDLVEYLMTLKKK